MGLKEFCVMLLAGGMGAGSVVTVQAVKAPSQRDARGVKAKPKPRQAAPRPRLPDCPTVVVPLGTGLLPELADARPIGSPMLDPRSLIGELPDIGRLGPGTRPAPPPVPVPIRVVPIPVPQVTGAVPEGGTWAMMVAGFGLIGMALRRRQRAAA